MLKDHRASTTIATKRLVEIEDVISLAYEGSHIDVIFRVLNEHGLTGVSE